MSNFPTKVESLAYLTAVWKIDSNYQLFDSSSIHERNVKHWKYSDIFKFGYSEFKLCLCKNDSNSPLLIGIDPIFDDDKEIIPSITVQNCWINVVTSNRAHKTTCQQEGGGVTAKLFCKDNVMWRMDESFTGPFNVQVILKYFGFEKGYRNLQQVMNIKRTVASLGRMLSEKRYTDVTINTSDGVKIGAHRAILAARSPVFNSMFLHDCQEKELSTINITDMSTKTCQLMLKYIYGGNLEQEELVENRVELVGVADKYDIPQLKETCIQSLCQDIDKKNVVEMLQTAGFYGLPKLKNRCMKFLVKSGNLFDIQDELIELLQTRDRDLFNEIFREVVKEWKSCREGMEILQGRNAY